MNDFTGATWLQSTNQSFLLRNTTAAHCSGIHTVAQAFFMASYSTVFVVGVLLNGFTLKVSLCGRRQTSSSVGVYLKNLAVADFFISLCLPLRVAHLANSSALLQRAYCTFGASAFYLNMYASILFMGYIAANRYLKIVRPLGTPILQTMPTAHLVSAVTWGFLVVVMTTFILLSLLTQPGVSPNEASTPTCDALHSKQIHMFYKVSHCCMAAIFLLVLTSLLFFYHSTTRRLRRAQQRQLASPGSHKLARSRRNLLVLVGVFCVCFVPYHLIRLPYAFRLGRGCGSSQVLLHLKELTTLLSALNVCLDPLIYFFFCKTFRAQLGLQGAPSNSREVAANVEWRSSNKQPSDARVVRRTSVELVRQNGVPQTDTTP